MDVPDNGSHWMVCEDFKRKFSTEFYWVFVATEAVAGLASVWNIPVISWYSADSWLTDKSYYTTLIRTYGSMEKTGTTFF